MHQKCRRDFTDAKRLRTEKSLVAPPTAKKVKRSGAFYWKTDCFICGKLAVADARHPDRIDVLVVSTILFRENLLQICHERNDAWSSEVEVRLHDCIDLVAADAIYHKSCHSQSLLSTNHSQKKVKVVSMLQDARKTQECLMLFMHSALGLKKMPVLKFIP